MLKEYCMTQNDLKVLDCTLRDGGYINDWKWGYHRARAIIRYLTKAKVDFVEVGFLRNVVEYDENITVCNTIEELNRLLPSDCGNTVFSAMAMRSNYDIEKLTPYSGTGIEMIRITAHENDIQEGLEFAKEVKAKGYKLSINPINIMGYSDEQLLWIIKQVNEIQPYQFSIVDTFGSMKRRDLDRIVSIVDNNLNSDIRVALHLHENMALSCCLAQQFVDKHLKRPTAIDASLLGMGRIPGNLPIELVADYLNDYVDAAYDIDYMMDAIHDYIEPIKGKSKWGYTPAYFLSAKFNLHRNYAEYYLNKGDLTHRDINHILAAFDARKAAVFDELYANEQYMAYKEHSIDDTDDFERLRSELKGKNILLIAPGTSIAKNQAQIEKYIDEKTPFVISINFIPEMYDVDMAFFSNNRRFEQVSDSACTKIVTSNIENQTAMYRLNYNRLSSSFQQGYNSYVMLLKLLKDIGIKMVAVAGADGYIDGQECYYKSSLNNYMEQDYNHNLQVKNAIRMIGIEIDYITKSKYE